MLADDQRKLLHEQVRSRWAKLVMASIGFLLITGLINIYVFLRDSKTPAWEDWHKSYSGLYNAVFGVKFLLAMAIFFIASALAGRRRGHAEVPAERQMVDDRERDTRADGGRAIGHFAADPHGAITYS